MGNQICLVREKVRYLSGSLRRRVAPASSCGSFDNQTRSRSDNANRNGKSNEGQTNGQERLNTIISHQSSNNEPWICVICRETERESGVKQLPCSHELHTTCSVALIQSSLNSNADQAPMKCPICRQEFSRSIITDNNDIK